jgi:plasmid stabilization system protein ParE
MANYEIVWSPRAKITYTQVIEYLYEEWTIKEIKAFIHRTEQVIGYISDSPKLYPYSKTAQAHRCVVVKQVSLFYRVKPNHIELLVFWDNRQNPAILLL